MKTWHDLNIEIPFGRNSGRIKVNCPLCHSTRSDKRDRSLSVNLDEKLFKCHHCGWAGSLKESSSKKEYAIPVFRNNTNLSDKLVKYFEKRMIPQNILKHFQIGEGMEWMPQHGKEMNTVQFNYFCDGKLVNTKFRTGDKKFKFVTDAKLIPYNIDAIRGTKEAIITEGEIDCLSYASVGFPWVISVPNGGSDNTSYLDDFIELFEDKETIYIASDTDAVGLRLRNALVRRFGAEICKIVTYGDSCKDANEILSLRGAKSLCDTIANAQEIKIEGIFTVDDISDDLDELYQEGLKPGLKIQLPGFDDLCSFETKRLAIVTGIPGSGKSEFIDEVAERLNALYDWKIAYFSPENFPLKYHASKIASKITGKRFDKDSLPINEYHQVKDYMKDNYFFICPEKDFTIETILEKAKYLIRRKDIKALVIDPWNRLEHQIPHGMSETNYVSKALDEFTNFAQRNDILIVLMAHPRKMNKDATGAFEVPTLYDISGSANFFNKTDYGITVHRDREAGTVGIYVQKVKFRHLGTTGTAFFKYNLNNGRYTVFNDRETVWDNSNHLIDKYLDFEEEQSATELEFKEDDNDCPF